MHSLSFFTTLTFLCVLFVHVVDSRVIEGTITTTGDFVFMGKFCFKNADNADEQAASRINIEYTPKANWSSTAYWAIFYDSGNYPWDDVYYSDMPCSQVLEEATMANYVINPAGGHIAINPLDYSRPHFWYVAILNCDNSKVKTYYKLTFINTDGSQFSFDESGKPINFALVNFPGLLPMSAVFFTTYALLIGASCFADYFYWRKRAFHALLQAIGICLIVMFFAFMFSMSHWASYANNGIGCPACNDIVLDMAVQILFTLVLIILAKGWAITTQALTGKKIMFGLFGAIICCYLALYIWGEVGSDPASNDYIYATPPGILVLVLRVLTLVYFVFSLFRTYTEEHVRFKKIFYWVFGSIYSGWFLLMPFVAVVALAAPYWYREKTVDGLNWTTTFLGLSIIVFLLWPSHAYKYFEAMPSDLMMSPTQSAILSDSSALL